MSHQHAQSLRSYARSFPRPKRSGTIAVEFAILCPIILLFCLAGSDFARVSNCRQVVLNAVRAGTERGSSEKFTEFTRIAWEERVRQAVFNELELQSDYNPANADYTLSTEIDSDGLRIITIEVSYKFETVVSWPGLPSDVVLRSQLVTRQFR